jgi:hypothetical protein
LDLLLLLRQHRLKPLDLCIDLIVIFGEMG